MEWALLVQALSQAPYAMGWIAWVITMRYLFIERKRYQDIVLHFLNIMARHSMLDSKESADDIFLPPDNK